jgi:ribosomal peptide maturation radical SAM protein 1
MPWAIFNRPSIQLSSLRGYLQQQDDTLRVDISHPYLEAARQIGLENYRLISENTWCGEALYCSLLFPERRNLARDVFYRSLDRDIRNSLPDFDTLAGQLDVHLEEWLAQLDFSDCSLVGFTICFTQLPPALLAAGRIKKKYPQIPIVLGGSTCSPRIGSSLLRVFPAIDFIINGEGEQPLLRLCRYLSGKRKHPGHNVQYRETGNDRPQKESEGGIQNDEIQNLDLLPLPDYDDYFLELKNSGLSFIPLLPLEFSRGCWWNRCTFCNLNLQWCGYRNKSSTRVLQEVDQLVAKYRCLDFAFTDNSLPPKEADRFFAATRKMGKDLRFFGEIRTLNNPEKYILYREGGLNSVQVGIESFSNSLLKRMQKGVTVMDNIAAMKYAVEAGIKLDGNLILEFPGSTEKEVEETLHVLDFVLPYRPLKGAGFFLGHGSPVWNDPKQFGLKTVVHHPHNRQLYPEHLLADLEMLIHSFHGDRVAQRGMWKPVREKIRLWSDFHAQRKSGQAPLSYRRGVDFILIRQERPGQETLHHRLHGLSQKIYLACRRPVPIKSLLREFNSITEKQLLNFLADLEQKRLLYIDRDSCLALAVRERRIL